MAVIRRGVAPIDTPSVEHLLNLGVGGQLLDDQLGAVGLLLQRSHSVSRERVICQAVKAAVVEPRMARLLADVAQQLGPVGQGHPADQVGVAADELGGRVS